MKIQLQFNFDVIYINNALLVIGSSSSDSIKLISLHSGLAALLTSTSVFYLGKVKS